MTLFTLISGQSVHLEEGQKIVQKKDYTTLKKAIDLVKQAKEEAEEQRLQIEEEAVEIKENAKKEGFDEGLKQVNEQLVLFENLISETKNEVKEQILPILLSSLKKILGEELKIQPDRIVNIIMQSLKPVVQHHHITVYVNKDDLEILEKNKKKLVSTLQQVEVFSIQERPDIEAGGCIIETESGIINAQLDNQIRALETALKSLMRKKK